MATDWTQGARLAPDDNRQQIPDPAEYVRRYPEALTLYELLEAAQDVDEAYRGTRTCDVPTQLLDPLDRLLCALDAMRRTPR
jgi:hypothetical protein